MQTLAIAMTTAIVWGHAAPRAWDAALAQGFGQGPPRGRSAEAPAGRNEDGDRGDRGRRGGRRGWRRDDEGGRERRDNRPVDNASAPATASPPAANTAGTGTTGFGSGPETMGFGTSASAATDAGRAEGIRKWAADLVRQHDKNGNRMLEADEQSALRGPSRGADLNSDGVITLDELIHHVTPKPSGTPTSQVANVAEKPATAASQEPAVAKRPTGKFYRFRSAKEHLPEGLPGWFTSKDANGDAQVSMSEYSRLWTDRLAAEFQRYDRNNDGMISPEEAQAR